MTYDPTVPGPAQRISDTQAPIQNNFNFIQTGDASFLPESINYNNRDNVAPPITSDPALIANAFLLYCKNDATATTDPELFGRNENGDIIQLTAGAVSSGLPGFTFLPGGMLLQWDSLVTGDLVAVPFAEAFSAAAFYVGLTTVAAALAGQQIVLGLSVLPTATDFTPTIRVSGGATLAAVNIMYIALGARV